MATPEDIEKGREEGEVDLWLPLLENKEKDDSTTLFMVLLSTAVAVCGSFVFGASAGYSSPVQYQIMDELKLSYSEYSVFGSIVTIGAMIGAITCGRIADSLGRKGAMRLSSIICITGFLAIFFATSPSQLYLGRFLNGYGIGIISYVVPVFITEITPVSSRGALTSTNQLFIVIGLAACYTIGAFVQWRTLALAGVIPCLLLFLGLFVIPESPRWLAISGREEDFEAALRKLRGSNADISAEGNEIKVYIATLDKLPKVTVMNLFDRVNCRATIISVGLMAFQQFAGINGIVFYASKIFKSASFDPTIGSIAYSVLQVFVTAIGAVFIDKAGRRPLLLISATGLLIGNLLIGLSFLLQAYDLAANWVPYLAVIGVLEYIFSFAVGMGAGPWLIMSEVFPLHVKGMGGGLVTLMNWFGSWAVSFSFNFLMLWSSYGTFFLYALVCVLSIIFIFKLIPETKGRSLEEIHASLNSSPKETTILQ